MRLIFAGTPDAAVPSLRALLQGPHEVMAVLTRPDAPTGRGRKLRPSPVKELAVEHGLEILEAASLRADSPSEQDAAVRERLVQLAPDAIPVVAYGALIPPDLLTLPQHGWINLHFSLLPAWRGAAPVQHAILSGATRTGMSVFRIDEGLDTGPILAREDVAIGPLETSGELLARMAEDGAALLGRALDGLRDGSITPGPQTGAASHAGKIRPADAQIDWTRPGADVATHIRAMSPQPGAWTMLSGQRFKILSVEDAPAPDGAPLVPGQLHVSRRHLHVGTGDAPVALGVIAPAGKKAMRAVEWARGAAPADGTRFDPAPMAADAGAGAR